MYLRFCPYQEFVWGLAHRVVFPGIMGILGHRQHLGPIVLSPCDPRSQVLFYPGVHPFGLSIGSWVEGRGEILLDP